MDLYFSHSSRHHTYFWKWDFNIWKFRRSILVAPFWRLETRFLNLLYACLGRPLKVVVGLYHCAKSGWNRCSSFDNNVPLLIFSTLASKCLFMLQLGLGFWPTQWTGIATKSPKRHVFVQKHVICRIDRQNRSTARPQVRPIRMETKPRMNKRPRILTVTHWVFG